VRKPLRLHVVVVSLLVAAIAIGGFWRSYFAPLLAGTLRTDTLLHLHAGVFMGWVGLLIAQAAFAARGRIDLHRQLGRLGIGWGVLLILVGLWTTGVRVALQAREVSVDTAAAFLVWPLLDMVLFGLLFGAAVALRHRPPWHKRLMIAASVALLVAPVGRLLPAAAPTAGSWFMGDSAALHAAVVVAWLAPLLIAAAHDLWRHGRVHAAYLGSIALLVASSFRDGLTSLPGWSLLARQLIAPFG
jgi:hypothetical protein